MYKTQKAYTQTFHIQNNTFFDPSVQTNIIWLFYWYLFFKFDYRYEFMNQSRTRTHPPSWPHISHHMTHHAAHISATHPHVPTHPHVNKDPTHLDRVGRSLLKTTTPWTPPSSTHPLDDSIFKLIKNIPCFPSLGSHSRPPSLIWFWTHSPPHSLDNQHTHTHARTDTHKRFMKEFIS